MNELNRLNELIEKAKQKEYVIKKDVEKMTTIKSFLELLEDELIYRKDDYNYELLKKGYRKERNNSKKVKFLELKSKHIPNFKKELKKHIRFIKFVKAWTIFYYNCQFGQYDNDEEDL